MRPIGGVILGKMGDTYGRKIALEISILLMATATFVMGCLPSYNAIGWPDRMFIGHKTGARG